MFKRLFDLTVSIPVVVIVLPPLCVLVKIIHLMNSPGPLFFRQVRCGRDSRPFVIIKFRTMHVPAEGESEIEGNVASRIFPMGNLLRVSKIDEFPQFLNVLGGSMSIVGPRPHHFDDCKIFAGRVQDYAQRTVAKPGITGLAQYTEYRGKFQWNCVESRVAADLKYIRRWTPILDLLLILKTVSAVVLRVLRGRPAAPAKSVPSIIQNDALDAASVVQLNAEVGESDQTPIRTAA
ncbi:MAG: sugar transferase [Planctomycetaceae bacterium]